MDGKSAQVLWQDYWFLTKEMKKFLTKPDMDLFYNLMNQREQLQSLIDQTADDGFKASPEGQSLLAEIKQENEYIMHLLQSRLNRSKRYHQVAEVYNSANTAPMSRRNWKR